MGVGPVEIGVFAAVVEVLDTAMRPHILAAADAVGLVAAKIAGWRNTCRGSVRLEEDDPVVAAVLVDSVTGPAVAAAAAAGILDDPIQFPWALVVSRPAAVVAVALEAEHPHTWDPSYSSSLGAARLVCFPCEVSQPRDLVPLIAP